jgi:hypothetical protein
MESGTEVLRVTSAIVSAFQTAADTLEIIQDRKEKKRRKKDKDVEELMEMKILHKSLVEVNKKCLISFTHKTFLLTSNSWQGGLRCRKHCENRHQLFSPAFEAGDDIAILALKDVLISIQGEVIQALHIARAVENAILDFTTLHETSVTNRKDATRAMDQLCHRIMASMQYGLRNSDGLAPSSSSMQSSLASVTLSSSLSSYDLPPSPPVSVASPRQQRAFSQSTLAIRPPSDIVDQRGSCNAPQASSVGWMSAQLNHSSGDETVGNASSSFVGRDQHSHQNTNDLDLGRRSLISTPYFVLGSDRVSVLSQPVTAPPTTTSRYPPDPSVWIQAASEQTLQHSKEETESIGGSTILASGIYAQNSGGNSGDEAETLSTWSRTTQPPSQQPLRMEPARNQLHIYDAPEVVSPNYEGMYIVPDKCEKYPALLTQADYAERLLTLPLGMDNIWIPLMRPAMHNRYHGFCKGAWQIRKAVRACLLK